MAGQHKWVGADARKKRQQEAVVRDEQRKARTPAQQWDILDKRLGVEKGALKERKRLWSLLHPGKEWSYQRDWSKEYL